ncbi:5-formyltetrahydrofolate cyclo-ligase [Ornithinibacillus sp. BX22]|uniref:5-formyltetrahydrofolate cyclo-ligase n=2 Tax=Ornithinibacillus TaxID=484508 RepID=A0A923L682_9BACI|nr:MULTISPECIES: 5-formyltetrahydrofolate cyclo-ligase [Ornithinibacillus]MBC5637214.1 5-formyltetrahydrofolate cyclo-ligase [Ornithinibacillus hominis]MBS3679575.1 5-formyltetrahydrofolate cyclo-ligase [Ornithinibacillus massiliensis]
MQKEQLRKQVIQRLQAITDQERNQIEKKLQTNLFQSDYWKEANTIGVTISRGFEWDTKEIIEEGWRQGKVMAVPKCYPEEKEMAFYRLHSFAELETVYSNLLEPKPIEENFLSKHQMDLILVPGVVFDSHGFRIGFGGGYYDRFLASYQGNTIAILSNIQLVERISVEAHDIAVKHLLSEDGFII